MPVAKAEPIFNFYVIACLLLSLITLVLSMGVSFERGRITAVIRIVSFNFSLNYKFSNIIYFFKKYSRTNYFFRNNISDLFSYCIYDK